MDPISGILGLAGLGLDIFGTIGGMNAAHQAAQVSQQIAGLQTEENAQRQLAMQVTARRSQMEVLRTSQQARAQAVAGATNQGAAQGSGLQGGLAQVAGQSGSNLLGVDQQLSIGNTLFGLEGKIGMDKVQLAGLQGQEATYQGLGTLGGALGRNAGPLSNIFGNLGGLFGGGQTKGGEGLYGGSQTGNLY